MSDGYLVRLYVCTQNATRKQQNHPMDIARIHVQKVAPPNGYCKDPYKKFKYWINYNMDMSLILKYPNTLGQTRLD